MNMQIFVKTPNMQFQGNLSGRIRSVPCTTKLIPAFVIVLQKRLKFGNFSPSIKFHWRLHFLWKVATC